MKCLLALGRTNEMSASFVGKNGQQGKAGAVEIVADAASGGKQAAEKGKKAK